MIRGIPQAFEAALERWRFLYRAARNQADQANRIILDHSRVQDHESAKRLRQEAEAQLKAAYGQTERHPIRLLQLSLFRERGFSARLQLPPPAPIRFHPRPPTSDDNSKEFISRPRFLAISEFGPGALIYHEGARYQVTRIMMPLREEQTGETSHFQD